MSDEAIAALLDIPVKAAKELWEVIRNAPGIKQVIDTAETANNLRGKSLTEIATEGRDRGRQLILDNLSEAERAYRRNAPSWLGGD
jgi:hypothetical protein